MSDRLAKQILELRSEVTRTQTLRAQAEGNIASAKQRLAEIDEELRKLGVDPENADAELQRRSDELEAAIATFRAKLTEEAAAYTQIIRQSSGV